MRPALSLLRNNAFGAIATALVAAIFWAGLYLLNLHVPAGDLCLERDAWQKRCWMGDP